MVRNKIRPVDPNSLGVGPAWGTADGCCFFFAGLPGLNATGDWNRRF
jgi:hypothetical protein